MKAPAVIRATVTAVIRVSLLTLLVVAAGLPAARPARADMEPYTVARLQSLDKMTARTMTFDVKVGSTVKFGPVYIRVQTCRKAPAIEAPEAAAFLQIWEVAIKEQKPQWIFSGWMYASSPALSAMEHPVYDVWLLDCRDSAAPLPAPFPAPSAEAEKTEREPSAQLSDDVTPDPEAQTEDSSESPVE